MSLLDLFNNYAKGNTGNTGENFHVTADTHATPSGNMGNTGNIKNNIIEVGFKNKTASVYQYRTTENPKALLTMVTQGKTLDEARHILENRYNERLLSVESANHQTTVPPNNE